VVVLAVAGASAFSVMVPIALAIIMLLAMLVFSYRQVIDAIPQAADPSRSRGTI
jgi:hypothetical protein